MRQGDQEKVSVGENVRLGGGEDGAVEAGMAGQLRVRGGHRRAGVAVRGQRTDLEVGVAGQQAEQFAARVATGPRYRNPRTHLSLTSAAVLEEYSS